MGGTGENVMTYRNEQVGDVWFYWKYYIYNYGPTANPISDQSSLVGTPVHFYGSGSDPEGDNIYYEWDFGDGETSIDQNPTHTYNDAGVYTVKFRVKDYFDAYSSWRTATVTLKSRVPLVARGWNNGIYYRIWTDSGGWGEWKTLPGETSDTPGAAVLGNTLHIVVRGMDNGLYHGKVNLITNTFSGWDWISGATPSERARTPSAPELFVANGGLVLLARGMDNRIYFRTLVDNSWRDWKALPGNTCESPAAVAAGSSSLDYFVITVKGLDENIWYGFMDLNHDVSIGFSGWKQLPGETPSKPTLIAWKKRTEDAVIYLIVQGFDDALYTRYAPIDQLGTFIWSDWARIGSTTTGPAATVADDNLHLVVQTGMGVFHNGFHALGEGSWSGWDTISGASPSPSKLADFERSSLTSD
jgi:PKD repeat protein